MSALENQVGGGHYKGMAIQPVEYNQKNKLGFCESNVVKYISRWREKGGLADLKKAKHFIDLLIQIEGLEEEFHPEYFWSDDQNPLFVRSRKNDELWEARWADVSDWRPQGSFHPKTNSGSVDYHPITEAEARKLIEDAGGTW